MFFRHSDAEKGAHRGHNGRRITGFELVVRRHAKSFLDVGRKGLKAEN